jgi:hypothetical protein
VAPSANALGTLFKYFTCRMTIAVPCAALSPGGGGIGLAPINRDLFRRPMTLDGLGEEAPGRLLVALLREQEINGLPHFIDGAIQVPPVPAYFDIGIGLPGATEKFWAVKP